MLGINVSTGISLSFLLLQCLLLSACSIPSFYHTEQLEQQNNQLALTNVYDLDQSTNIIIDMIKTGEL